MPMAPLYDLLTKHFSLDNLAFNGYKTEKIEIEDLRILYSRDKSNTIFYKERGIQHISEI